MFIALTESDALALTMLTMIMVSFGVILTLLVCMVRSSNRRDEQVDRLIDELKNDRKRVRSSKETNASKVEPWEKKEDWWKE